MMILRKRHFEIVFLVAAGLCASIEMARAAEMYRNDKYNFSLNIPVGMRVCMQNPPNPDHGLVLIWKQFDLCNALSAAGSKIEINGEFNAVEYRDLSSLRDGICGSGGHASPAPVSLSIRGRKIESCLVKLPGKKVNIWLLSQENSGSNIDKWINYEIGLLTTRSHLTRDMIVFHRVLNGMRLGKGK